jgi:hypothetical protein
MSKKTIAFTIPPSKPEPRRRPSVDPDGLSGESPSLAPSEGLDVGDARIDSESDEWVRDRDLGRAIVPSQTPSPWPPFDAAASVTIDLAAERSLMEAFSLSFLVPFTLGWFWFVNAMARPHRMWGA